MRCCIASTRFLYREVFLFFCCDAPKVGIAFRYGKSLCDYLLGQTAKVVSTRRSSVSRGVPAPACTAMP